MKVVYTDASRLYIDPSNYDSLAITFVIFSSFLTSQDSESLRNFKGFFACSALFNFQDTVLDITFSLPHFRAATFILYHTFELLSSELFVNAFNIS